MLHTEPPVKILCKQLENISTIKFFEGAVINYKVILSLSMRLQIVANHQDCLNCDTFALPCYAIGFSAHFILHVTLRYTADSFRLPSVIPECTYVCEIHWPQEADKSKSNFHYLPEINNC